MPDADVREDWEVAGLRHRLIDGCWETDATRRLQDFFDDSTYQFLPDPVLAFNTFRNFVTETCTLYDGDVLALPVKASELGEAETAALGLDLLWPQMQQVLEFVRAMNDALVLRTWDPIARTVRYEPVAVDAVRMTRDPVDGSQPAMVEYHHERDVPGYGLVWCRDRWVKGRPGVRPTLTIEAWVKPADGEGRWVDVTLVAMPEAAALPGYYPYWTQPPPEGYTGAVYHAGAPLPGEALPEEQGHDLGEPIWPWTAYHRRITSKLREPHHGSELVDLSLVASVLWTYWVGGLRDVAYQQRFMMDADVASAPQDGQPYTAANPMMVMRVVSKGPQAELGAWPSPMNPKEFAEAIGDFQASGAIVFGLSSADVSVSKSGLSRVSGFAIEVSREGKRKVEKKSVKPQTVGDRHNLAGAAQLANAYGGTALPVRPAEWELIYTQTERSPEETRAVLEETKGLVEAGLLHPADALIRFQPGLKRPDAERKLVEISEFRRFLAGGGVTKADGWKSALKTLLEADDLDVPRPIKDALRRLGTPTDPSESEPNDDEAATAA